MVSKRVVGSTVFINRTECSAQTHTHTHGGSSNSNNNKNNTKVEPSRSDNRNGYVSKVGSISNNGQARLDRGLMHHGPLEVSLHRIRIVYVVDQLFNSTPGVISSSPKGRLSMGERRRLYHLLEIIPRGYHQLLLHLSDEVEREREAGGEVNNMVRFMRGDRDLAGRTKQERQIQEGELEREAGQRQEETGDKSRNCAKLPVAIYCTTATNNSNHPHPDQDNSDGLLVALAGLFLECVCVYCPQRARWGTARGIRVVRREPRLYFSFLVIYLI